MRPRKKYKKVRTLTDIENDPRVSEIWREDDGFFGDDDNPNGNYWVALKAGFQVYGNCQHVIHEPTIAQVCEVLNDAEEWPDDPDLAEVKQ